MKTLKRLTAATLFFLSIFSLSAADTTVTINAGTVVYTVPDTFYACNLSAWSGDEDGNDLLKNEFMQVSGRKYYRWPGGPGAMLTSGMIWKSGGTWVE